MGKGGGIRVYHVIIVLLILYLWSQGYFDQILGSLNTFQRQEQGVYYGNVKVTILESNYINGSSVTTSSAVYKAYPGDFRNKGGVTVTTSGNSIDLSPSDNGVFWVEIYGGSNHYVYYPAITQQNPRANLVQWYDKDQDGYNELFVKFDVSDYPIGSDPIPNVIVTVPLIPKDVSGLSDDNPSDISSIGTSEVVKQITWKYTGLSEGYGLCIGRIYFTTNATRGGEDIALEDLQVQGWGLSLSYSQPHEEHDDTYTVYYLGSMKPGTRQLNTGVFAYRKMKAADQLYITLNVRCTMESGDVYSVTLNIDVLNPDGSLSTTLTDTVVLSA